jgi:hypothetical protein
VLGRDTGLKTTAMTPIQEITRVVQNRFWSKGEPSTHATVARCLGKSETWVRKHAAMNRMQLDGLAATTGARLRD